VTFHYTDAEVVGLRERRLRVYRAATPAGPFLRVPTALDSDTNTATVTTSALGVFVLREAPR